MYLNMTVENFVTIGVMLAAWIVILHVAAQMGLRIAGSGA